MDAGKHKSWENSCLLLDHKDLDCASVIKHKSWENSGFLLDHKDLDYASIMNMAQQT
jgi:hypothetical protein